MLFSTFCDYIIFFLKDNNFNNYYMKGKYVSFCVVKIAMKTVSIQMIVFL